MILVTFFFIYLNLLAHIAHVDLKVHGAPEWFFWVMSTLFDDAIKGYQCIIVNYFFIYILFFLIPFFLLFRIISISRFCIVFLLFVCFLFLFLSFMYFVCFLLLLLLLLLL